MEKVASIVSAAIFNVQISATFCEQYNIDARKAQCQPKVCMLVEKATTTTSLPTDPLYFIYFGFVAVKHTTIEYPPNMSLVQNDMCALRNQPVLPAVRRFNQRVHHED